MTVALLTPPVVEPLALAQVKQHLRVDHDHEDGLIAEILTAARQYAEHASGQRLITQRWRQYENALPASYCIVAKLAPVAAIETVTAFDAEGEPQVLAGDAVSLVRSTDPASIEIDQSIDPVIARNGLEIDLITGYGDLGTDVPDIIKRAILLLVAHWYEFRGAISPQEQPVSLPPGFDALLAAFRRCRL